MGIFSNSRLYAFSSSRMFLKKIKQSGLFLPVSSTLTYWWNLGSFLGMILVMQIVTGTCLAIYYSTSIPFESVAFIMYEVNYGWLIRILHLNGANLFFIVVYLHIMKALVYGGYKLWKVWYSGLLLLLLLFAEAFMGYVLVWAQMSYWAAVVITSLVTVTPHVGELITLWVWGGFVVNLNTLKFLFVLHFLIPYLMLIVVILHLVGLHETGSTNVLGVHGGHEKVTFYPYYWVKDKMNVIPFLIFLILTLLFPFELSEKEMFMPANPLVSPVHIVPEWYFLYAYAILRAVPNKGWGVVLMLSSLFVLLALPHSSGICPIEGEESINLLLVFCFAIVCILLSWLGHCHPEYPFVGMSQVCTLLYFVNLFIIMGMNTMIEYFHGVRYWVL